MRILIYTDCHFSQYSSIIRSRGEKYSTRLENLIESLNWAEGLVASHNCDRVICLGDFFDAPVLNSEELTALREIKWSKVKHQFLVGNHESNVIDLRHNSTNSLNMENFEIITEPKIEYTFGAKFIFLPYIVEEERLPLDEYIVDDYGGFTTQEVKRTIAFSHNDIKGVRYGKFESTEGFDLRDIEDYCHLFLNGHLHNGAFLNENETILNVGNLTGQNFGEDANEYAHYVCILDTNTMQLEFYENPYAFNFYKLEVNNLKDLNQFDILKNNAVITVKCVENLVDTVKDKIKSSPNIKEHRIIITPMEVSNDGVEYEALNDIDHLKKFNDFIIEKLGRTEVVVEELSKIIGG